MAGGARNLAHPGFARIGVHDPKHTFRRRLRATRFSEEDRKALLGHRTGASRLTTRQRNWTNWSRILATDTRVLVLTILKRRTGCPP